MILSFIFILILTGSVLFEKKKLICEKFTDNDGHKVMTILHMILLFQRKNGETEANCLTIIIIFDFIF